MFIATDFHIRIANQHLDDLRGHADRRRHVRLARRAASADARNHDVRVIGTPPTLESPPSAVVSLHTSRAPAGCAA